jgi:uncharacterized protein YbjT (DUF2867 family)
MKNLVLVTGATGRQGGAVLRHLLAAGFPLRALTRDGGKSAALKLREQGVEVVQGDQTDPASLGKAVAGAWGVYSVQN